MRTLLLVLCLVAIGCKDKKADPSPEPTATAKSTEPAKPAAPAAAQPAPAKADPAKAPAADAQCCCVGPEDKDGTIWHTSKECTERKGTCVAKLTEQCESDITMEKVAEERNAADAECPSKDRKDCDGDGFRHFEDKDDNNAKVH